MREIRCKRCRKLLLKGLDLRGNISAQCPRCGNENTFHLDILHPVPTKEATATNLTQ